MPSGSRDSAMAVHAGVPRTRPEAVGARTCRRVSMTDGQARCVPWSAPFACQPFGCLAVDLNLRFHEELLSS